MGMYSDAQNIKSGYLDEMFDAGTWKVRNIWDGVKLEVGENESPVVLHSFTHLDPDLPLFEVSQWAVRKELYINTESVILGSRPIARVPKLNIWDVVVSYWFWVLSKCIKCRPTEVHSDVSEFLYGCYHDISPECPVLPTFHWKIQKSGICSF